MLVPCQLCFYYECDMVNNLGNPAYNIHICAYLHVFILKYIFFQSKDRNKTKRYESEVSFSLSPISSDTDYGNLSYDDVSPGNLNLNSEDEMDILIQKTKEVSLINLFGLL